MVTKHVQAVAKLGGDPKWEEDFAERTQQRLKEDKKVTGVTKLIEVLQLPEACLSTFRDWIGVDVDIPEGVALLDPSDPITSARHAGGRALHQGWHANAVAASRMLLSLDWQLLSNSQ